MSSAIASDFLIFTCLSCTELEARALCRCNAKKQSEDDFGGYAAGCYYFSRMSFVEDSLKSTTVVHLLKRRRSRSYCRPPVACSCAASPGWVILPAPLLSQSMFLLLSDELRDLRLWTDGLDENDVVRIDDHVVGAVKFVASPDQDVG